MSICVAGPGECKFHRSFLGFEPEFGRCVLVVPAHAPSWSVDLAGPPLSAPFVYLPVMQLPIGDAQPHCVEGLTHDHVNENVMASLSCTNQQVLPVQTQ